MASRHIVTPLFECQHKKCHKSAERAVTHASLTHLSYQVCINHIPWAKLELDRIADS